MKLHFLMAVAVVGVLVGCVDAVHASVEDERKLWSEIREAWSDLDANRQAVAASVRFTVSEKQLKRSSRFKFLLQDQLKKTWLFKTELTQVSGSVAIDNVATLVGIPSVPYFKHEIEMNDRTLIGSVQLFIENKGDFAKIAPQDISSAGMLDVAEHHALGWLMMNHHVHAGQFLVADDGSGGASYSGPVYRIDNSVEWYLMGQDRLTIDYSSPVLWHAGGVGYLDIFRHYIRKSVAIDLPALFATIEILRTMPDDLFLSFFAALKNEGFANFSGITHSLYSKRVLEHIAPISVETFEAHLLRRKRDLRSDFVKFYRDLSKLRGEKWVEPKVDIKAVLAKRRDELRAESRKWRQMVVDLESKKPKSSPKSLHMIASEAAHRAVRLSLTEMYNLPKAERVKRLHASLERLNELEKMEKEPNELAGIRDMRKTFESFVKNHETDSMDDLLDAWRFHMRLNEARR